MYYTLENGIIHMDFIQHSAVANHDTNSSYNFGIVIPCASIANYDAPLLLDLEYVNQMLLEEEILAAVEKVLDQRG